MGLVEEADHGTLFLDGSASSPLATQVKLLRTLENERGAAAWANSRRPWTCAWSRRRIGRPRGAVAGRSDLYYRLNVVQLDLPPLRERRDDVGLLASFFLDRAAPAGERGALEFTPDGDGAAQHYDYPGNVRELENAIEHAVALSEEAHPRRRPATRSATRACCPASPRKRHSVARRSTPARSRDRPRHTAPAR